MKRGKIIREKSLTATAVMIVTLAVLFLIAYYRINVLIRNRCLGRMEEGVNTVVAEVTTKLKRDSRILNAAADILANSEAFDKESIKETMATFSPLVETMQIRILMPDNTIIQPGGTDVDGNGWISFQEIAARGEHVSNRITGVMDKGTMVLRHYVPIIKDEEPVAVLYGVTRLDDLPGTMNIDNIYNASASVYIIDAENGDFILDTWHKTLGNLSDHPHQPTKNGMKWDEKMQELMNGETGYVVFLSDEPEEWQYLYYAPANINNWMIAVSVPEREAFQNLYEIRRVLLIIAGFIVVTICLYYLWARKNARAALDRAVEKAVLEEKLQKAEAAEKAKTMFLSNMSHDIRTPMNAIIGFTTLAQTNVGNPERVQEYLGKILSSSNHLLSLINDILDMSRIESGRLNIEEKECSISDIFRDMRNIIQTQMQVKQLDFFMDTMDVTDEEIYCDKLHVNQILLNLLSNAIKFTPAGGSVSLTVRQLPEAPRGYGSYEIRVRDTGIGMSPEFAKHIFEPFEREQNTTVSGIQGTGLGMAITKSIVDAMGGSIRVESEQGKGTEFIIRLDFRLQEQEGRIEVIHELEGLRALVVDDSFSTCDSVTKMLMQIGMRAEWTMHGKEALLRARQAIEIEDEYHAYIIDWVLPDLNGVEVARQLRATVGEKVPIIVLTAYDWSAIEAEARDAGVTSFCSKPIFLSELRDTLAAAISEVETQRHEPVLPGAGEELKGKRLLLVEDNELNREIAQELLRESGFEVETAEDGTVAVEMVKHSNPGYYALVLMDVQMPVMNGYDATKAIRALDNHALADIPIVAMTANAFDEDRRMALDSGMNAHVAKPIDVKKLFEVLNRLLSKK